MCVCVKLCVLQVHVCSAGACVDSIFFPRMLYNIREIRHFRHMLQHAATRCNTLQHTATYCNTLQRKHTASHYDTLQHSATQCNTLQHAATHCNTYSGMPLTLVQTTHCSLRSFFAHYNTLQHTALHATTQTTTHYSTLQQTETHCNTPQHTTTHCNTATSVLYE